MSKVTDIVAAAAKPIVESVGCELWDVEYVKEPVGMVLRVYIDREGGVDIDRCEAVSRKLDPILDELDPIAESYTFEVSSAGAERQLKRPSDFERFMGSNIAVKLYRAVDGRKEFVGTLAGYNKGDVTVSVSGKETTFAKSDIADVRLRIDF